VKCVEVCLHAVFVRGIERKRAVVLYCDEDDTQKSVLSSLRAYLIELRWLKSIFTCLSSIVQYLISVQKNNLIAFEGNRLQCISYVSLRKCVSLVAGKWLYVRRRVQWGLVVITSASVC
jgi:hypothetical protein